MDTLANGKWRHMMDQTHIGYTYWQQPEKNVMPQVANINTSASAVTNTGTANIASATSLTASNKAKSTLIKNNKANAFYERDGYVSIEAEHFTRAVSTPAIKMAGHSKPWQNAFSSHTISCYRSKSNCRW
jgi:hypothetical protein